MAGHTANLPLDLHFGLEYIPEDDPLRCLDWGEHYSDACWQQSRSLMVIARTSIRSRHSQERIEEREVFGGHYGSRSREAGGARVLLTVTVLTCATPDLGYPTCSDVAEGCLAVMETASCGIAGGFVYRWFLLILWGKAEGCDQSLKRMVSPKRHVRVGMRMTEQEA